MTPERAAEVRTAARDALPAVRRLRRDLHRHPELGWTEFYATSRLLAGLRELGIGDVVRGRELYGGMLRLGVPDAEVIAEARAAARAAGVPEDELAAMGEGHTGLVATIDSGRPGPRVTLRADIDALPIEEAADHEHGPAREGFRSGRAGIMHACGHDGHAATLMGVARALRALGAPAAGSVRLIFQPAEEGARGAESLVAAGWLDGTERFLSLHNSANFGLTTGHVSGGVHEILATTKFDVRFTGREAHYGMAPELGRSALTAASAVSLLAHALPRKPGSRSLTNVGRLESGTARNIVPGSATLLCEVRSNDGEEADELFAGMRRLVSGIGTAFEVTSEITTVGRSPAADSDPELVDLVREVGEGFPEITMHGSVPFQASDDAAAMMRHVQRAGGLATYLHIGSPYAGTTHTPRFDIDEESLAIGITILTAAVLELTDTRPTST